MKYIMIPLFFSVSILHGSNGLLKNRVTQRNCKQQLDMLLAEIGVKTVEEAMERVQGLPNLLNTFESSSVAEAIATIQKQGTQKEVAALLRVTKEPDLMNIVRKSQGMAELLRLFQSSDLKDVEKRVQAMMHEKSLLHEKINNQQQRMTQDEARYKKQIAQDEARYKKQIAQDEARYKTKIKELEDQYEALVRQCKKIEQEFKKISV